MRKQFVVEVFSVLKKNPFITGCSNLNAHTRLRIYITLLTLAVLANCILITLSYYVEGKENLGVDNYSQYLACAGAIVIAAAIVFHVYRTSRAAISSLRRRSALGKVVGKMMFMPIIIMVLNLNFDHHSRSSQHSQAWFTILNLRGIFISLYTLFLSKDARRLVTDCCMRQTSYVLPGAISLSQPALDTEFSDEESGHEDEEIVEGEVSSSYTALPP